jgi:hypothetical protein
MVWKDMVAKSLGSSLIFIYAHILSLLCQIHIHSCKCKPVLVIAHVVGKVEGAIHGDEQPGRNVHKLLIAAATDPGVGEAPCEIIQYIK